MFRLVVLFVYLLSAIEAITASRESNLLRTSPISSFPRGGDETKKYGRTSKEKYILTPEQIETFHREGCVTITDVLTEEEMLGIDIVFDKFLNGEIPVPGKDFCDMSKPFGIPRDEWSIVNCMLPTRYYAPFRNNVYEKLTACMAKQLFTDSDMTKDYDQLLNKMPGKSDAVFAWHQGEYAFQTSLAFTTSR